MQKLAVCIVVVTVALVVAAEVLPKLLGPAAIIFAMVVIGRLTWYFTQRW